MVTLTVSDRFAGTITAIRKGPTTTHAAAGAPGLAVGGGAVAVAKAAGVMAGKAG